MADWFFLDPKGALSYIPMPKKGVLITITSPITLPGRGAADPDGDDLVPGKGRASLAYCSEHDRRRE